MKSLGASSSFNLFTCKQRENERVVWCSREIAPSRPDARFLGHQKRVGDGLSLSLSFHHKDVHPISAVSSAQPIDHMNFFGQISDAERNFPAQPYIKKVMSFEVFIVNSVPIMIQENERLCAVVVANAETEEIQTIHSDQLKTVNIRFKLQKQCAFGQQFLLVGDDPVLGLWDTSDAVPLNWSDGHVWIADIEIPSGKALTYKFILSGDTGTISWQPGPDRILETWDTDKTITVFEDWDNPELRNIVEEELVADLPQDSSINLGLSMVADNLTRPNKESLIDSGSFNDAEKLDQPILEKGIDVLEDRANDNGLIYHAEEPSAPMVAANITEKFGKQELSSIDGGSGLMTISHQKKEEKAWGNDGAVNGSYFFTSDDQARLVSDEEIPVLVPGLIPIPSEDVEEEELNLVENNAVGNTTVEYDGIKDSKPEIKDDHVSSPPPSAETSEMMIDEKPQLYEKEQLKSDISESYMQWGEHVSAPPQTAKSSETPVDEKQQLHWKEQLETKIFKSDVHWGRRTLEKFLASFGFQ
ncbi:hypothetical protein Sango_2008200 [Sesamum angolense]|uniref:CBM20 domain-containing protein n=1 Tax=Sesamum angolense TaxID=2727404 RepID=A0AAE1WF73_9LAMI|nr:hypothetical protein Sango_2008200 [Sesamum angolense]